MTSLLARIDDLLAAPTPASAPRDGKLARAEQTLTDGYAHALALEGESCRLTRELREAAGRLDDARDPAKASEICGLARRLARADRDLAYLRERLGALRVHARALRV